MRRKLHSSRRAPSQSLRRSHTLLFEKVLSVYIAMNLCCAITAASSTFPEQSEYHLAQRSLQYLKLSLAHPADITSHVFLVEAASKVE